MENAPFGQVPAHGRFHAFFKGHGPGRHAVVEVGAGLGPGNGPGAVTRPHGVVPHHVVFFPRNQLALLPDGRPDATVRVDGVIRPVPARLREVIAAGKRRAQDLEAELARGQQRDPVHGLGVARPAVEQKDPHLPAVGAARDPGFVPGLVDHHADVPIHAQGLDPDDVLLDAHGDVRHPQHRIGVADDLFARDGGGQVGLGNGHGDHPFVRSTCHCLLQTSSARHTVHAHAVECPASRKPCRSD